MTLLQYMTAMLLSITPQKMEGANWVQHSRKYIFSPIAHKWPCLTMCRVRTGIHIRSVVCKIHMFGRKCFCSFIRPVWLCAFNGLCEGTCPVGIRFDREALHSSARQKYELCIWMQVYADHHHVYKLSVSRFFPNSILHVDLGHIKL